METKGTLLEALGIEVVSVAKDKVVATMPVDERTMQPFGYLHGGATAALLETVASIASTANADLATQDVFGVELCIRHVKSPRERTVTGTATPHLLEAHKHVWDVECRDDSGELLSSGTCAVRIVPKAGR
ncbi:MAG: PaaI family thioesterase [Coriobacteriia bacterium]|nr:PaaI family thioesterase [Coriobacteriia bacterium]